MNYLVAVLPDRTKAEAAYTALKAKIPAEQIAILGQGYTTPEEFGMLDPQATLKARSRTMAFWLIPFGFVAGFVFNLQTGIEILSWAGAWGNHIIGGVFGAIAGAMGSFFVGGGVLNLGKKTEQTPYRDRLKEGKYLVAVKGSASLKNQATEIIRQFEPEDLQSFTESASV